MTADGPIAAALERFEAAADEVRAALAAAAPPPPRGARSALQPLDADEWWASLPPDRREQIRRWITQRDRHHEHVDGQLDALDHLIDHHTREHP